MGRKIHEQKGWPDPLEEIESKQGREMSKKMHQLAEKPTRHVKRARDKGEAYRHFHRR
ncbi:hypothetical protein HY620_01180 [Candidatus Uhrbacteria bacterium]|nr:hypothetical protein [Candidatus Uhrbacteria bacterium]